MKLRQNRTSIKPLEKKQICVLNREQTNFKRKNQNQHTILNKISLLIDFFKYLLIQLS